MVEPDILIGGGFAVGVAVFLIKFLTDLVRNTIRKNTEAIEANSKVLLELANAIKKRNELIEPFLKNLETALTHLTHQHKE